jgi:hypothetical protein
MSLEMNAGSPHHHHHRRRQGAGFEYALYFALVLLISVPTALFRTFLPDPTGRPRRFFLVEAWSMARRVTPQIFAV